MRRRFILYLSALLILLPASVLAQTPFWDVFDTQNTVLPSNGIQALSFDVNGDLWVATTQGLARRNDSTWDLGPSLTGIGLDSDYVSEVAYYDGDNALWIGTQLYGLFKLDSGNWLQQGPAFSGTNDIFSDPEDGSVWIASESGLRHFNGSSWTVYNDSTSRFPSEKVKAVKKDAFGQIWVGTHTFGNYPGGMAWFDGSNWFTLNRADGLPNVFINDFVFDSSGNLWIASDGGVFKRSINNNWQTFTPNNSALPNIKANTITIDTQGNIWVGTEGGIGVNTPKGWTNFLASNSGLPDNRIRDIIIDPQDGTAWIATENGVAHFDRVIATSTSVAPSLEDLGHSLRGPYPNPSINQEAIYADIELAKAEKLSIELYDGQGRKIYSWANETYSAGVHNFRFSLQAGLAKGLYLFSIKAGDAHTMRKLFLQ